MLIFFQDLINIGHILRIPECSDAEGRRKELDFNRRLRSAQKQITEEDKQESALALATALRANTSVDDIGLSLPHTTVKAVRYDMVKLMQGILGRVMIRRTLRSTRWDGSKINPNLPEKSVVNFCVRLTDHEHGLLNGELGIVGRSLEGQVFDFEVTASLDHQAGIRLTNVIAILGALPGMPLCAHSEPINYAEQEHQVAHV